MDEAQQVDIFSPAIMATLWLTKHGAGAESRMNLVDAALARFEGISPAELRGVWDQAAATVNGVDR